jgi:Flp pilus assembly protein TadG
MWYTNLKSPLRSGFARSEKGSASIEAIFMIPLMFFCMISFMTLIDFTRQHGMHQKAAYAISDMISRETVPIDNDYLAGTHALMNTLTRDPQNSTVRLSVVRYDAVNDIFKLDWSKTSGFASPVSNHDVRDWTAKLPTMVHNERMIVVETSAIYEPPFQIGLGNQQIDHFIFTRPRYSPQILWQDVEGSGDYEGDSYS